MQSLDDFIWKNKYLDYFVNGILKGPYLVRNIGSVSNEVDEVVRDYIKKYYSGEIKITRDHELTLSIFDKNGKLLTGIWIGNYPYSYGNLYFHKVITDSHGKLSLKQIEGDDLPKFYTRILLKRFVEKEFTYEDQMHY